jgi:hypothetical protein
VIGDARSATVLTGCFLGGATAEIVVVRVVENGDRTLQMYGSDGREWVPVLEAKLGADVSFIDVANIGGRDRLITYAGDRLSWFDPDSATENELVELAMNYRATNEGEVPRVDIARDLNRDGLDDLLAPAVDGFWISIQRRDGSFTAAVKLGPPEPFRDAAVGHLDTGERKPDPSRSYGDIGITAMTIPLYLSRVHELDYDQDGRVDLVFWNDDRFEVHLGDENGGFAPVARKLASNVPFDSDGTYSHAFAFSDQGAFSAVFGVGKKAERTVLHSLRDLNGDRVVDLVTLTLSGRSITRQRSVYEVHFGTSTPDGIVFARDAGTAIRPQGRAGGLQPWGYSSQWFQDLDGDGQFEILFRDVHVGVGGMMRALVGNSVPIDLELYRNEGGIYPTRPTATRQVRRFAPFAGLGNVFFPAVLLGDVNGDGRSDLLVGQSPKELHVFLGEPGSRLLARQPRKVAVALPYDERNSWLVDLDQDGKQDLLMHRAPTGHAPAELHRLTILLAR